MDDKCFLCGQAADKVGIGIYNQTFHYHCQNCGEYDITSEFHDFYDQKYAEKQLYLLSGYIREMNEKGNYNTLISYDNYINILSSPLVPHTIGAKFNKLLLFMYHRTRFLRDSVKYDYTREYSICYASQASESIALFQQLLDEHLVRTEQGGYFSLTFSGIQQAEKLEVSHPDSNIGFVAMWFTDEMKPIYDEAIKPAIEAEECGSFIAYRVDKVEHNDNITDAIIAGIRDSRFVVADMTGYRGGVYFEAGFANGLGKSVIYTCRKDWFNGEYSTDGKIIKEKIHFDVDHQNIIVWETKEELKRRIIDRIRATIF